MSLLVEMRLDEFPRATARNSTLMLLMLRSRFVRELADIKEYFTLRSGQFRVA